ncbi:fungal-specific transcription factor domain-containing protein [Plectosphaerella plurivora]|uniref:Fungal-specific transcription factor domain-containing protein n=1 Tax=Plectosphaerella plurivora TaxID=936078 RepID=A0A9P8VHM5_9PEZI|nr:fungal-specific transcription factor domain-containing protein [Plectosphaerella plurivora]
MKATRGCWTCKKRKIGCDKTLPGCNNCARTGRECAGYGCRISWPDESRKRARDLIICTTSTTTDVASHPPGTRRAFLNFTFGDYGFSNKHLTWRRYLSEAYPAPAMPMSLHTPVVGEDASYLAYYDRVIAPMCSTTRARNGFQCQVLPLVLSSCDASADSLRASILAISAYHRQQLGTALTYKTNAMGLFRKSLTNSMPGASAEVTMTQLSTCMMLCMHSVFDEHEENFRLHLDAAKHIFRNLSQEQQKHPLSRFLAEWILYYDVLCDFAEPKRDTQSGQRIELYLLSSQPSDVIIGIIGCSGEVFDAMRHVNRLRRTRCEPGDAYTSEAILEQRFQLEMVLQKATQRINPADVNTKEDTPTERIMATAQLYRLATLLYLLRAVPDAADEGRRRSYLNEAFMALRRTGVATSPWAVFVVACESRRDTERSFMLDVLDKMVEARNIGNIRVLRTIVEAIWKQQDIADNANSSPDASPTWPTTDYGIPVPWYA